MIDVIRKDLLESRIDWKIVLIFLPTGFMTYLFHEFGHWTVGELLGNKMVMSLNNSTSFSGSYLGSSDYLYISIGGPLFTIFQALFSLAVIEKTKSVYAFPLLFFAGFSRMFSLVFGGFMLQDESKIAKLLDVGSYSVAILVLLILALTIWHGCRLLKINLKGVGYYTVLSVLCILIVIGVNELVVK